MDCAVAWVRWLDMEEKEEAADSADQQHDQTHPPCAQIAERRRSKHSLSHKQTCGDRSDRVCEHLADFWGERLLGAAERSSCCKQQEAPTHWEDSTRIGYEECSHFCLTELDPANRDLCLWKWRSEQRGHFTRQHLTLWASSWVLVTRWTMNISWKSIIHVYLPCGSQWLQFWTWP